MEEKKKFRKEIDDLKGGAPAFYAGLGIGAGVTLIGLATNPIVYTIALVILGVLSFFGAEDKLGDGPMSTVFIVAMVSAPITAVIVLFLLAIIWALSSLFLLIL